MVWLIPLLPDAEGGAVVPPPSAWYDAASASAASSECVVASSCLPPWAVVSVLADWVRDLDDDEGGSSAPLR
jgi:hypothetical protein